MRTRLDVTSDWELQPFPMNVEFPANLIHKLVLLKILLCVISTNRMVYLWHSN